jgi:dihydropteroate synthase type 2
VNVSEDSFSDGGRFLAPAAAIAHAERLLADGADVIDVGAAASHPDAKRVPPDVEIRRLEPVVDALRARGAQVSIDTFAPEVQDWAVERGVAWLNDIDGFPDPERYPRLARARAKLVVVHSVQGRGRATRVATDVATLVPRIEAFLAERVAALEAAGVARERIVVDPGMGFFLGSNPEASLAVLRALPRLRARIGLPLLVSVSRKSFLGALTGREIPERGAATLAAELFAASNGADYLRTHDVRALRDALAVARALAKEGP